jgi:hypothetical protein
MQDFVPDYHQHTLNIANQVDYSKSGGLVQGWNQSLHSLLVATGIKGQSGTDALLGLVATGLKGQSGTDVLLGLVATGLKGQSGTDALLGLVATGNL